MKDQQCNATINHEGGSVKVSNTIEVIIFILNIRSRAAPSSTPFQRKALSKMSEETPKKTIVLRTGPDAAVFLDIGRDIQNRTSYAFTKTSTVLTRFQDSFGCNVLVAMMLWSLLQQHDILPAAAKVPESFGGLWYMCNDSKILTACQQLGRSGGET